jgi:transposase InsO family protein
MPLGDDAEVANAAMRRGGPRKMVAKSDSQWTRDKSYDGVQCYSCNEYGHIKKDCPKWQAEEKRRRGAATANAATSAKAASKCRKCGASNHRTSEHDDEKTPQWRKDRMADRVKNRGRDNEQKSKHSVNAAVKDKAKARPPSRKGRSSSQRSASDDSDSAEYSSDEQSSDSDSSAGAHAKAAIVGRAMSGATYHVKSILQRPCKASQTTKTSKSATKQHGVPASATDDLALLDGDAWGVDTMASVHLSGDRSCFVGKLQACKAVPVKVADGSTIVAKRCGTARIDTLSADGKSKVTILLKNTLFNEQFSVNLISWVKLKKQGWQLHSAGDDTKLVSKNNVQIQLSTSGNLVVLRALPAEQRACALAASASASPVLRSVDDLMLLHERLCHVSFDAMLKQLSTGACNGLGELRLSAEQLLEARQKVMQCRACAQGRGTRTAFGHQGLDRGSRPFETLHIDLFHLTLRKRSGGTTRAYGVGITDPFSEHIQCLPVRWKDEVPDLLVKHLSKINNHADGRGYGKLLRIHVDGGGEFINHTIKDWCAENGVELHWPPAKTPKLNGIAERLMRKLKDGVRTLMMHSGASKRWWHLAAAHFTSVWNRTRVSKCTGVTPHESLYDRKPSLQHFGVFGCDAFYHVPKDERVSLDPKMEPCIYLGHDRQQNCSVVYRLRERDTHRTRDVKLLQTSFRHARAVQAATVQEILHPTSSRADDVDADEEDAGDDAVHPRVRDARRRIDALSDDADVEVRVSERDEVDVRAAAPQASRVLRSRTQGGRRLQQQLSQIRDRNERRAVLRALETSPAVSPHLLPQQRMPVIPEEEKKDEHDDDEASAEAQMAIAALRVACTASTGMAELEKRTPKTYAAALQSGQRSA